MMSNIACFLHHASCRVLRTLHCQCWLISGVSILWHRSRSCLSFCSVCNNFVGSVLPFRPYIWHWYWLHRYIVSSICHELDNISLMVSESVVYSAVVGVQSVAQYRSMYYIFIVYHLVELYSLFKTLASVSHQISAYPFNLCMCRISGLFGLPVVSLFVLLEVSQWWLHWF